MITKEEETILADLDLLVEVSKHNTKNTGTWLRLVQSAFILKKAFEKQITKPVNNVDTVRCPVCGCSVVGSYCHDCGQRLEYSK